MVDQSITLPDYRTREVVGVFADPGLLEAAADQLEKAGFDRSAISVLGSDKAVKVRIGHLYRTVAEIEDDPHAPRASLVPHKVRDEEEAAALSLPFYVGGLAGAVAVVASGGALAFAIAAAILGGAAGISLGGLLGYAVAGDHAKRVAEQIAQGGFVLWVRVSDTATEQRAVAALKAAGARDLHVHEISRGGGAV
jgi:hypothetical protein